MLLEVELGARASGQGNFHQRRGRQGGPILTWGFGPDFISPHCVACGALVPHPAMEAVPPAVEARSLNQAARPGSPET